MNIWAHGSNVNFQTSAREMNFLDLTKRVQSFLDSSDVLMGDIQPDKQQLTVYGTIQKLEVRSERECWNIQVDELITMDFQKIEVSHEAVFDILDEEENPIRCTVLYFTFIEDHQERIYFMVEEGNVPDPLACVTQFWSQVEDLGREMDLSGCSILPFFKKGRS